MLSRSPIFKPSLVSLAYILRNPSMWPQDFTWNFQYHGQCALGLSDKLWPGYASLLLNTMTEESFKDIFIYTTNKPKVVSRMFWIRWERTRLHEEVSPDMVADHIEEYLERSADIKMAAPLPLEMAAV